MIDWLDANPVWLALITTVLGAFLGAFLGWLFTFIPARKKIKAQDVQIQEKDKLIQANRIQIRKLTQRINSPNTGDHSNINYGNQQINGKGHWLWISE